MKLRLLIEKYFSISDYWWRIMIVHVPVVNINLNYRKYDVPVWKMCEEVTKELPEIFTPIDVIKKVEEKWPEVPF